MNQPIRVLNLFTIMNRGGAETMVMNYYRKIDRTKVQFDFMVHRQERGAYDDEIESLGGRIFRMSPITPATLGKYLRELRDFFQSHPEYRILHAHMSELGYFTFKEAEKWGVPVRICHAHNVPVFLNETFKEKVKRVPREILAHQIRKLSTDCFACSKEAGFWLFGRKRQFTVMKNAIDTSRFIYDKNNAQRIRREYDWDDKFVIGHVGRFCPQKNHQFVVDVFNEIQKELPQSVLVLIGDGPLKEQIQYKVESLSLADKVFFLGNRDDVNLFYQAFDIFLFPSLYEGFGNVLLEAQAAGLMSFTSKDVVPLEARVTSLLHYIPLSCTTEEWKNIILGNRLYERKDMSKDILNRGFDITENASWLCDFYLKKYQEYE